MTVALQVSGVRASYGDLEILKGVDIEVPFGEVHVLMGPNGSGKSTLCHVLMGKDEYDASGSALDGVYGGDGAGASVGRALVRPSSVFFQPSTMVVTRSIPSPSAITAPVVPAPGRPRAANPCTR